MRYENEQYQQEITNHSVAFLLAGSFYEQEISRVYMKIRAMPGNKEFTISLVGMDGKPCENWFPF